MKDISKKYGESLSVYLEFSAPVGIANYKRGVI